MITQTLIRLAKLVEGKAGSVFSDKDRERRSRLAKAKALSVGYAPSLSGKSNPQAPGPSVRYYVWIGDKILSFSRANWEESVRRTLAAGERRLYGSKRLANMPPKVPNSAIYEPDTWDMDRWRQEAETLGIIKKSEPQPTQKPKAVNPEAYYPRMQWPSGSRNSISGKDGNKIIIDGVPYYSATQLTKWFELPQTHVSELASHPSSMMRRYDGKRRTSPTFNVRLIPVDIADPVVSAFIEKKVKAAEKKEKAATKKKRLKPKVIGDVKKARSGHTKTKGGQRKRRR